MIIKNPQNALSQRKSGKKKQMKQFLQIPLQPQMVERREDTNNSYIEVLNNQTLPLSGNRGGKSPSINVNSPTLALTSGRTESTKRLVREDKTEVSFTKNVQKLNYMTKISNERKLSPTTEISSPFSNTKPFLSRNEGSQVPIFSTFDFISRKREQLLARE